MFGHEGLLYENSFVMYDKGTDSLWIHVTGEAVTGPLKGNKLQFFPSVVTSWKAWKKKYPHTGVLEGRRDEGFMGSLMEWRRSSSNRGLWTVASVF